MNKLKSALLVALSWLALTVISPNEAFAKRLGSGKSFGSRPSYSESYRPTPDASAAYRASQSAHQPAMQRNQAMRDSFRSRGGLMGMLGGLAVGGLLGAILFGGGFEHINLFDLVVMVVAAYLLFRMFTARRRSQWGPLAAGANRSEYASGSETDDGLESERQGSAPSGGGGARFDTNVLFRSNRNAEVPATNSAAPAVPQLVPAGFDVEAFMAGAKKAYRHLQSAWDDGDLAELRTLTTKSVYEELSRQLRERSGPATTRVVSLDARLLEVSENGSTTHASVLFDAWVQEEGAAAGPTQALEVWHFIRNVNSRQPTWFLDGVQQVDL